MAAVTNAFAATGDTSNVTTYASTSFTPTAGDLLVVFAAVSGTVAAGSVTASANSMTFTKVTTAVKSTSADTLYCFVSNQLVPSSPASMTVTMDVTGDAGTGAVVMCARVSGITRVGLAAIRQFKVLSNQTGGTTPTITFDTACLTGNPTLVGNISTTVAGSTPPTNWTEQVDTSYSTPTTGGGYVSRDSGFTGTGITWGSAITGSYGLVAIEVEAYSSSLNPRDVLAPPRQAPIRAAVI